MTDKNTQALRRDAVQAHMDLRARIAAAEAERDEARAAHAALLADVEAQHDAFLASDGLSTDWIAGWHSAVKHVAAVIAKRAPKEAERLSCWRSECRDACAYDQTCTPVAER